MRATISIPEGTVGNPDFTIGIPEGMYGRRKMTTARWRGSCPAGYVPVDELDTWVIVSPPRPLTCMEA
jgi:hypothetical protein